jgi:hypothetical protein
MPQTSTITAPREAIRDIARDGRREWNKCSGYHQRTAITFVVSLVIYAAALWLIP